MINLNPTKNQGKLSLPWMVSSSCSTSGPLRFSLLKKKSVYKIITISAWYELVLSEIGFVTFTNFKYMYLDPQC
jgi:hypothetical protein